MIENENQSKENQRINYNWKKNKIAVNNECFGQIKF
jgi:hypothetical protein